ncbi:MAG: hypothetical protein R3A13_04435 [Bdellovibrionota bacterium]
MSDLAQRNNSRAPFLALLLASLFACIFMYEVTSPWIQGMDSVTRLLAVDQTIVVLKGNPWLPALQVVMQVVHLFSDSPQVYKAVNFLIACTGLFFFTLVIAESLGLVAALISTLYFFYIFNGQVLRPRSIWNPSLY